MVLALNFPYLIRHAHQFWNIYFLTTHKKQMQTTFHVVIECPKMDESKSPVKNTVVFYTFGGKSVWRVYEWNPFLQTYTNIEINLSLPQSQKQNKSKTQQENNLYVIIKSNLCLPSQMDPGSIHKDQSTCSLDLLSLKNCSLWVDAIACG